MPKFIKRKYKGKKQEDEDGGDIYDKDRQYKDIDLIKRALKYVRPYKWQFAIIMVIITLNAFIRVYPVTLLKTAIDLVEDPSTQVNEIYAVGLQLILFYLLGWVLTVGNNYFMGYISQHTTFDIRQEMHIKLQILSFSYFDRRKAGKIMSRVMNDVAAINTLMTNGFPILLGDSLSIIYIMYLLLSYSLAMTLIVLLIAPTVIIFSKIISKRARRIYRRSRKSIADVYTKLEQGVAGMKTIKAFTREKESLEEFVEANRANRDVNIEAGKLMASVGPIFQTFGFLLLGLVFIAAFFFLRTAGTFELGAFIAFILLVLQFYGPINQLANFYNQIQNALAGGERIFSLLDADVEVAEKEQSIENHEIEGRVDFKNVYFHYEEGIPVLKDISLRVDPKTSLAIVGYTGAGKTTLINLLCRFYDPIAGKVIVEDFEDDLHGSWSAVNCERTSDKVHDDGEWSLILGNDSNANEGKLKYSNPPDEEIMTGITFHVFIEENPGEIDVKLQGDGGAIGLNVTEKSQLRFTSGNEWHDIAKLKRGRWHEIEIHDIDYEENTCDVRVDGEFKLSNIDITGAELGHVETVTISCMGTGNGKCYIDDVGIKVGKNGKILIDDIDLRDYSLKALRGQLGIVLQHPFLFTDTVFENIRYGSDASLEEVIQVAKKIGAHEFIMDLEDGYNTQVRERGVILSQGQRQLISFARALMANPKILILDEATSSLDSYSEMLLQRAIEEITKNRTSFIIAHRLSTIRNADKIIVLENGEIIEQGSHEALIEKDGLYAKLYRLQFRDLELIEDGNAA